MMRHQINKNRDQVNRVSRGAFTLVEILVALAIFSLLLVIILVPVNMGFKMLHLGKASADVQDATQATITQMRGDLSRAVYVYPNDVLPSVTGIPSKPKLPYGDPSLITGTVLDVPVKPYFDGNPCDPATNRVSNLARLDMLLPDTNNGTLLTPVLPTFYVVSYYARRRDVSQAYQPNDNPIVLFRAQIPFRYEDSGRLHFSMLSSTGAEITAPPPQDEVYPPAIISDPSQSFNANIYDTRYTNVDATTCGTDATAINRSDAWLEQSVDGEPNLEPLTTTPSSLGYSWPVTACTATGSSATACTLYGSHTALLPIGIGMGTGFNFKGYNAQKQPIAKSYYPPKSTFVCADTNGDGIINQVTLNLVLEKVDTGGSEPAGQQLQLPQVIDLPNVRQLTSVK